MRLRYKLKRFKHVRLQFHLVKFLVAFLIIPGVSMRVVHAQTVPVTKAIDRAAISTDEVFDNYYERFHALSRKMMPRIIFVPGILGSKIDECRADGSECKSIWGTVESITDKTISLNIKPDRLYKTDVVDSLFFFKIYGPVLESLRADAERIAPDSVNDPLVTVFHYDWRKSNVETAEKLAARICAVAAAAPDSPIILIGHSMGGLVVKLWAKRYGAEHCLSNQIPRISKIIFIATPHLGSPKIIKALADGYSLLFDDVNSFNKIVWFFERKYVLDALNDAAISFPSVYELLPIQTSAGCRTKKQILSKLNQQIISGESGDTVDLFDKHDWLYYDLLRQIKNQSLRQLFYDKQLGQLLLGSRETLCDIIDFNPDSIAETTYIVGEQQENATLSWFRLHAGTGNLIAEHKVDSGDGTVPLYSAKNDLVSRSIEVKEILGADHIGVVSSNEFLQIANDWYVGVVKQTRLELGANDTQARKIITAEIASSGEFIPISLNAESWFKDDMLAVSINGQALGMMGYSPQDLAGFAARQRDLVKGARIYAVAASLASTHEERLKWTNQVARLAYLTRRFDDAIGTSQVVVRLANSDLSLSIAEKEDFVRDASATLAWAEFRSGNVEQFNAVASQLHLAAGEIKEPTWPPRGSSDTAYEIDNLMTQENNNSLRNWLLPDEVLKISPFPLERQRSEAPQ